MSWVEGQLRTIIDGGILSVPTVYGRRTYSAARNRSGAVRA